MAGSALLAVALAALSLLFVVVAAAAALRELRALTPVDPQPGGTVDDLLVVIPARNEAERIGPVLDAVLGQDGDLTVLVVDDRSTDATLALVSGRAARDPRLRVLQLHDDPPPGVFGKPRALQAALDDAVARNALPGRVLFLDADVELAPGAIAGLLAAFGRSSAAVLSGVPRLVCATATEALLVPTLASLVTGRFPPTRVHRADDPTAFLNGQLILASTATLIEAGGWRSVEGTVLEDVALARHLKSRGHALRLADMRAIARTRMYTSWREIVEGFGKNAVALLGPGAGLVGALSVVVALLPHAAIAAVALAGDATAAWLTAALVTSGAALQAALRRRAGAPVWPVLVLPAAYLGAAVVLGRASLRHLRGAPVSWRGRSYTRTPR